MVFGRNCEYFLFCFFNINCFLDSDKDDSKNDGNEEDEDVDDEWSDGEGDVEEETEQDENAAGDVFTGADEEKH